MSTCAIVDCPGGRDFFRDLVGAGPNGCVGTHVLGNAVNRVCRRFDILRGFSGYSHVRTHIPFRLGVRWVRRGFVGVCR